MPPNPKVEGHDAVMEMLSLMLADVAEVAPNGTLNVKGGGGVFVSPPRLPEAYDVTIAGTVHQSEGDSDSEELVIHLEQPDLSTRPIVALRIEFLHADNEWPGEPVSTSFAVKLSIDLFDEGVHRFVFVQDGLVRGRIRFLAKIPTG